MKKFFCILAVLGAVLLSNMAGWLPTAHAAYWCDWCNERGVCHDRNTDCPYWQDGPQGGRHQGHHRGAAHCRW